MLRFWKLVPFSNACISHPPFVLTSLCNVLISFYMEPCTCRSSVKVCHRHLRNISQLLGRFLSKQNLIMRVTRKCSKSVWSPKVRIHDPSEFKNRSVSRIFLISKILQVLNETIYLIGPFCITQWLANLEHLYVTKSSDHLGIDIMFLLVTFLVVFIQKGEIPDCSLRCFENPPPPYVTFEPPKLGHPDPPRPPPKKK